MMPSIATVAAAAACRVGELTNRNLVMPLLVFYPTSRCNSRCLSCDWWRSSGADDLSHAEIAEVARAVPELRITRVLLSGGEPLLRPDFGRVAALFQDRGARVELTTSGVLLARQAQAVAAYIDRVTVSLDGAGAASYLTVRGIDGLGAIETGLARLRTLAPAMPVTARATLHAANFRELPDLVATARRLGMDGISFLAADLSSGAFGRTTEAAPLASALLPGTADLDELDALIDRTARDLAHEFGSGFISETPEKLRRIPRYYRALRGEGPFPPVSCNAPWVSAVVEANGAVRPCFFHEPVGTVREKPLPSIIHDDLPRFRRGLVVARDPVCRRCVCSLKVGARSRVWA
jgi:MoaA/NifB/PqqE/SkfB family radical SAM enzyme